jgi:hypothetical protein
VEGLINNAAEHWARRPKDMNKATFNVTCAVLGVLCLGFIGQIVSPSSAPSKTASAAADPKADTVTAPTPTTERALPTLMRGAAASPTVVPAEDVEGHKTLCTDKWTKRGVLDNEMFTYCMNQMHKGYLNLQTEVAQNATQWWTQATLDQSIIKWTKRGSRDDEMVAYDFHNEADAYKDLIFESKQPVFNKASMASCLAKWREQFTMVEYCYKRAVGRD